MSPPTFSELLLTPRGQTTPDPGESAAGPGSLDALLAEIVRAAQTAWPDLGVPTEAFLTYLGNRLPEDERPESALRQLRTDDLYLACGCARTDARAIAAFDEHFLSVIDRALPKLGAEPDLIAEVKQKLRQSLLVPDDEPPRIEKFGGRGDLRGWVRVLATREALAMMRRSRKEMPVEDDLLAERLLPPGNSELDYLKQLYRAEFKTAFAEALAALPDRERTLLRQHVIDGLTIDQIGVAYRVHRASAARWLERARQRLLETTRAALQQRLKVESTELDSILRLIHSQLEVSLGGLFRRRRR
jgi:RNA polymerase sigma-70 factor (ECF subfamily)